MLTPEDQDRVIAMVRQIISNDRARRTRVQHGSISIKSAKLAEERDFEVLRSLLNQQITHSSIDSGS